MLTVKDHIRSVLKEKFSEEDISLYAFGLPYGYWIWDEVNMNHVQLKAADLPEQELRDALRRVSLSKDEIFKK